MCLQALKGDTLMPAWLKQVEKTEMVDKTMNSIILYLKDKLLRGIVREKNVTSMWINLESLYITKSLAYKLCLKQQLYFYRMVDSKPIME